MQAALKDWSINNHHKLTERYWAAPGPANPMQAAAARSRGAIPAGLSSPCARRSRTAPSGSIAMGLLQALGWLLAGPLLLVVRLGAA